MPNAPAQEPQSNKRAFWIPDDLYERVKKHVDRRRSSPHFLTINQFVRDALEERLAKVKR